MSGSKGLQIVISDTASRWRNGECGDETFADAIDAALRRAKAEGMEAAAKFVDDDCYIPGGQLLPDYEHRCKHNVNQKELAAKIRARAAQIEEGE